MLSTIHFDWVAVAVSVFAVLFFVVGMLRIVEFSNIGLGKTTQSILVVMHIVGCAAFSAAMVVTVIDASDRYKTPRTVLFAVGLVLLFPAQIYVGLKRRIKIRDSQDGQK